MADMLTAEEALQKLLQISSPITETERVTISAARGRVLAEAVYSGVTVPNADNSSMDGYAFSFADTDGLNTRLKVAQRIPAGSRGVKLGKGEAARIFTGAPLPDGADTVIRQEWCTAKDGVLTFDREPAKGDSVRKAGEDIKEGDLLIKAGTRLAAKHIGLAAEAGLTHLTVVRRPKVALMSTGDELVLPGNPLPEGKVYNSNRFALTALLEDFGCEVAEAGIIPDKFEKSCAALTGAAALCDLILTTGGVSVGEEDHVKHAIETEGKIHFWRIAVKPGKPLVYGEVRSGEKTADIIGLPGNPVSSYVTFLLFVRPYLLKRQGVTDIYPRSRLVKAASSHKKADERNEFLRAKINGNGEAELYSNQSSGVFSSLVWGDGLIDNPPGKTFEAGDMVKFIPFDSFFSL